MNGRFRLLIFLFCLAILVPATLQTSAQGGWQSKLEPGLWQTAVSQPATQFILFLSEQADLSAAAHLPTKEAKGAWVYQQLTAAANRTQPAIISLLEQANAPYKPFWIANMILVTGDATLLSQLARRPDVTAVYANPTVQMALPTTPTTPAAQPAQVTAVQPNLTQINADYAWNNGITGEGIVIGGQDTGYQWDHPALKNQYRGWNAATQTADHNYNWHDAFNDNPCGFSTPQPCDDNSHGTHTMGIMVGSDGGINQIGVAPGAKWIGCRNMDSGVGTPASYAECYQWFVAPTDLNDQNPDPTKAPHVINNSWVCPPSEGCTTPDVLLAVVENVRAAGIITVHAAGNSGPGCGTINTPPSIYEGSFTVGNVDSSDVIHSSSSRGPAMFGTTTYTYLKPNVVAPGTYIYSAVLGSGYGIKTGTSMAAPHVAGMIALLLEAEPSLIGQVDMVEALVEQTAVSLTTTDSCGGDTPTTIPNHTYGYGRIDTQALLTHSVNKQFLPVVIAP